MKTLSVAVTVAVVFAFIWIQESSAAPSAEMDQMEQLMTSDIPVEFKEEVSEDVMTLPYYRSREKRGIRCNFCCGCCTPGVCGTCCKFPL